MYVCVCVCLPCASASGVPAFKSITFVVTLALTCVCQIHGLIRNTFCDGEIFLLSAEINYTLNIKLRLILWITLMLCFCADVFFFLKHHKHIGIMLYLSLLQMYIMSFFSWKQFNIHHKEKTKLFISWKGLIISSGHSHLYKTVQNRIKCLAIAYVKYINSSLFF